MNPTQTDPTQATIQELFDQMEAHGSNLSELAIKDQDGRTTGFVLAAQGDAADFVRGMLDALRAGTEDAQQGQDASGEAGPSANVH